MNGDDEGITLDEFKQTPAGVLGAGKLPPIKDMPEPTEVDLRCRYRIGMIGGKVHVEEVEDWPADL